MVWNGEKIGQIKNGFGTMTTLPPPLLVDGGVQKIWLWAEIFFIPKMVWNGEKNGQWSKRGRMRAQLYVSQVFEDI